MNTNVTARALLRRLAIGALVGAAGASVWIGIVLLDGQAGPLVMQDLLAVTGGAFGAGLLFADLFGRGGRRGVVLAAIAAVLTTAVGATLAVILLGAAKHALVGPAFVFMAIAQSWPVAALWLGVMVLIHRIGRRLVHRPVTGGAE